MVVKGEDFVVGGGGSNPSMALFFLNLFFYYFIFLTFDEELEKVVIAIYSSPETDMGDNESGY